MLCFFFKDYIEDNCDEGQTDRYNDYCNVMLQTNSVFYLNQTCLEMGGRLVWFDTLLELSYLKERSSYYRSITSDLMTGIEGVTFMIVFCCCSAAAAASAVVVCCCCLLMLYDPNCFLRKGPLRTYMRRLRRDFLF